MNTIRSSSFLAGEQLTGAISLATALRPTVVLAGGTENEVRIADDGIEFRGLKVVDAGQLYHAFTAATATPKVSRRDDVVRGDIPAWWERLGCVRNPGAHTGEESARDGEIADLRAALADQVAARLPSGHAIVPIEPTEEMVSNGFESWPDEFFSKPEDWAAYETMTGCQKSAHKARLCYRAMVAAAPTTAVKPVAEMPSDTAPTDLSKRLREAATAEVSYADARLLIGAAEEIERYYGGMMAWKRTAESKDRELANARAQQGQEVQSIDTPIRPCEWTEVEGAGQVKPGDELRFRIGDKQFSERAKLILHAGTDKEEVIYDRKRYFYFITAMVLSGSSNHKNVYFRPSAAPAATEEKV